MEKCLLCTKFWFNTEVKVFSYIYEMDINMNETISRLHEAIKSRDKWGRIARKREWNNRPWWNISSAWEIQSIYASKVKEIRNELSKKQIY